MDMKRLEDWLNLLNDQPAWQAILDSLPDLVAIIDKDYQIRYANAALRNKFKDKAPNILDSPCYLCIHGRETKLEDCPHTQLLATGLPQVAELYEPNLGGHFLVSTTPLFDMEHHLTGSMHVMRDITRQKNVEMALQESQERYQQLVDLSPDAVVVHSDGNVVFANQAAFRLIGAQSMDDIKNHSDSQLSHQLDPFTIAHDIQTLASKAHTQLFETHSFRLDGQELDIEMIASPLTYDGKPAFQVVARDITARKRAEKTLRQSEANFRSIFEANPFPTAIIRLSDSRILLANRAALDMFGYITPPTEVFGFSFLTHFEDRTRLLDIIQQEGSISHMPLEIRLPSGDTRWVLANAMPLQYKSQSCLVLGLADITAQQRAEARLAQVNLQLEDALERASAMAMLAELRAKEAETLRRAGTIVAATLNQQEAIEHILAQLHRVVMYDSACVQLRKGDWSIVVGGRGYSHPERVIGKSFPINPQTPDWQAYQNQKPVILPDAQNSFAHFKEDEYHHIRSWMAVPLLLRDQVIGLLVLDSTEVEHFTEHSADLASAFADQVAIALENTRLYEQALHSASRGQILYQATLKINASLDLESVYQAVQRATSSLMPCDAFVIALLNEDGLTYDDVFIIDQNTRIPNQRLPVGEGMMGRLINLGAPVCVDDWDADADAQTGAITLGEGGGTRSVLGVPLFRHDRVIGAMSVQSYQPGSYHADDQELLEQLAAQAATTIENVRLFAETQRLAITDDLTGLFNHRYSMTELQKELDRSLRYGRQLSVMVIDADLLKRVNDKHGHLAGNQVIQALAATMRAHVRKQDILARFAGDEFLVILPETSLVEARNLAERLRQQVAALKVNLPGGQITVTISLGIATLTEATPETLDHLIARADDAMYAAKHAGRNRVAY